MRTDNIPGYPYYYVSKRGNVYTRKLRGSNKGTLGNWYKLKVTITSSATIRKTTLTTT